MVVMSLEFHDLGLLMRPDQLFCGSCQVLDFLIVSSRCHLACSCILCIWSIFLMLTYSSGHNFNLVPESFNINNCSVKVQLNCCRDVLGLLPCPGPFLQGIWFLLLAYGIGTSLVAQMVKRLPTVWETLVQFLGWEDLEKEMAIHSSIRVWKILWTEEPGRLQSMESQRVGHDWATSLSFSFNRHIMIIVSLNFFLFCFQDCFPIIPLVKICPANICPSF